VYDPFVLTWTHRSLPAKREDARLDTWHADGGDAIAVISLQEGSYALMAWWKGRKGQLTPVPSPIYPTLEDAQAEADRLVFSRVDAWSRLVQDDGG
jgi:hypothetical protein